jgi:adenylate kinase family enzyme
MTEGSDPARGERSARIAIVGNSGSGKSTLAKQLARRHELDVLELDAIVWELHRIALLRDRQAIAADLDHFLRDHDAWIIEGCYGELLERALPLCTVLLFLNPGAETCVANNLARPWEPHKYASKAEQDSMLTPLLDWVRGYYVRDDAWSLAAHRRLFDDYAGPKREITCLDGLEYDIS